jgi:hypothetical protein
VAQNGGAEQKTRRTTTEMLTSWYLSLDWEG